MFKFIVSLLYPKKCANCKRFGSYICAFCLSKIHFSDYQICTECQKVSDDGATHTICRKRFSLDGMISSLEYKGVVRKLMRQFKYPPYLSDLKEVLAQLFFEGLVQQEIFMEFNSEKTMLTFVPLQVSTERKRGYNQSKLLAYELANKMGSRVYSCLVCVNQFGTQTSNRNKHFEISRKLKDRIKNQKIVLVDDVTISGENLRECSEILKRNGAKKVLGVTLARSKKIRCGQSA